MGSSDVGARETASPSPKSAWRDRSRRAVVPPLATSDL